MYKLITYILTVEAFKETPVTKIFVGLELSTVTLASAYLPLPSLAVTLILAVPSFNALMLPF